MTTAIATRDTPYSADAEQAVLGAILVDGGRFLDIADRLSPADFFAAHHQHVYAAMRELATIGTPIDLLTVKEQLRARGHLDDVNPAYLGGLTDGVPHGFNIESYADIVRNKAGLRRLIAAANKILADAKEAYSDARESIDKAERLIFAVAEHDTRGDFIHPAALLAEGSKAIDTILSTKHGLTGVPTGFVDFDELTRGLQAGSLVLIAARPSMGKSAWALNIAYHAASQGYPVGFFSLEMSRQELFVRLVASVGRIDGHRLQGGYASQTDYERLSDACVAIGNSVLFVDDSAVVGVLDVRGKARRLKARHGLSLVVVDYLQLMQVTHAENRNLAIAEISRSLKLLAKELTVPVVALSQLSRETERRSGQKPMLSDLRDSGALEQDADLVVFIHRPEVYKQTDENIGLAEVIIAKQRNGPTGTVKLRWNKESTRFDNWSYA